MQGRSALISLALVLGAAALPALTGCSRTTSYSADNAVAVPEIPDQADRWVNGKALSFAAAKGDVVLVEAWHRQ